MPSTKHPQHSTSTRDQNKLVESAIMKKIYRLEKKRTFFIFCEYLLLISIFLVLAITTTITLLSILHQNQVLDMLELFTQDPQTIRQYLFDTLNTIYIETPKGYLFLSVLFLITAIVLMVMFGRKLPKLLHKLHSINTFGRDYH